MRHTPDKQRRVLSIAASAWLETDKPCRECTRHHEDLNTTRTVRTAVKGQRPAPALSTQHHSTRLSLMRCEKRRRRTSGVAAPHGAWRCRGPNRQTCMTTNVAGKGAQPPKCGRFPVLSLRHLFLEHREALRGRAVLHVHRCGQRLRSPGVPGDR